MNAGIFLEGCIDSMPQVGKSFCIQITIPQFIEFSVDVITIPAENSKLCFGDCKLSADLVVVPILGPFCKEDDIWILFCSI